MAMTQAQFDAAFLAGAEAFKSVEGYEELAAFGKDNVDAVMESSAAFAKGLQDLNKVWFDLAQASVDANVAATKKILGCKQLDDVIALQSVLAADGYGKMVADSRQLSAMSVKLAEAAIQPLAGHFNAAVETFTKPRAA